MILAIIWDEVFNTEKTDAHNKHIEIAKQKEKDISDNEKLKYDFECIEIVENKYPGGNNDDLDFGLYNSSSKLKPDNSNLKPDSEDLIVFQD